MERSRSKGLRLGAALVLLACLAWPAAHLVFNSAPFLNRLRALALQKAGEHGVQLELGQNNWVDWRGRVHLGPIKVLVPDHGNVFLTAEEVWARPKASALLRGRVELGDLVFRRVAADIGKGGANIEAFERHPPARRSGEPTTAAAPLTLVVQDAWLFEGSRLLAGPVDGQVVVSRMASNPAEAQLHLGCGGWLRLQAGRPRVQIQFGEVDSSCVSEEMRTKLPLGIRAGTLSGHVSAELGHPVRSEGNVDLDIRLRGLVISERRLAGEPIGPFALRLQGRGRWGGGQWAFENGELAVGASEVIRVRFEGGGALSSNAPSWVSASLLPVDFQSVLSALPAELVPEQHALGVKGPVSGLIVFRGAWADPEHWDIVTRLDLSGFRKDKGPASGQPLAQGFWYRAEGPKQPGRDIWVGEGNPEFVHFEELPRHLVRAITTSEDAGFFLHQGFDFDEIRDSLISLAEGRRIRGASTITQQLAKNLFLSRERTYARKVREALLTLALEAALPKSRLLEIYFNIIEWGPNVYGITEAAHHYFGVEPKNLSPKQAAFLATIIPNPLKYHTYYERGALTPSWELKVKTLLDKMYEDGILSQEQWQTAVAQPLGFHRTTPIRTARRAPY